MKLSDNRKARKTDQMQYSGVAHDAGIFLDVCILHGSPELAKGK